ncbi:MAG: hypothetical protein HRU69_00305 [Flammeovirgaceae bacterium]|nr:MAG: hypothetical protein HRU69_00305 [Flammeovirgaceae bacterium]
MKRNALFLSVVFILLVIAGIVGYFNFSQKKALSVWSLIPEQAVLVYESGNCKACFAQLQNNPLWLSVSQVAVNNKTGDLFTNFLNDITGASAWLASLHVTQRNNFDFVFYTTDDLGKATDRWIKPVTQPARREYAGFTIYELKQNEQVLSWVVIENFWIGSFTPFLVEDVIRTHKANGTRGFENQLQQVKKLPVVKNDVGNLFIRYEGLNAFISSFLPEGAVLKPVIGQTAVLDIKENTSLTLSGFSLTDQSATGSLLSYFAGQNPVAFSHKQLISNRALAVTNYGITDGTGFYKNLPLAGNSKLQDSLRSLAPINFENLFSGLGKELSVCLFERRKSEQTRVVLVDLLDKESWITIFNQLSKATESGDSLYAEQYGSYQLRKIEIKNLAQKLFHPLVAGSDLTYYTVSGKTLILSDNLSDLKRFLDDIDQEEVWGKSVATNQFLESTLLESNVSFYFNMPLLKSALVQRLAPSWKAFFTGNLPVLNRLGMGAIQFSNLSGMVYTHAIVMPSGSAALPDQAINKRIQVVLNAPVKSSLYSVRNHTTKQNDLVFQDSLGVLHYLSPEGKTQWSLSPGGMIAGEIKQIDYFNNGKLQLLFVTPGKLHVVDRLGNYVSPFPVSIPIQQPEFINVIDYDNSKRYRFIISDRTGKLWMVDKQGQLLDGWKPKSIEGRTTAPPRHYRIQGKDYIVVFREDGQVLVMNRKGEPIKGFPLSLDFRPSGAFGFEAGRNLAGSVFTCISKDGIKTRFTAEGKILTREPLVKSTVTDQFSLVEEKSGNGYIIVRQSAKRLTVFDDDGRELVANDYVGMNPVELHYYDFGSGRVFIALTDAEQNLTYVYDGSGNALLSAPVNAGVSTMSWDGTAKLYYADERILVIDLL